MIAQLPLLIFIATTVCPVINNTEPKCSVTNNTFYPTTINQCNATDILSRVKPPGEFLIAVCDRSIKEMRNYERSDAINCYPPEYMIGSKVDPKSATIFLKYINGIGYNPNVDVRTITLTYKSKTYSLRCDSFWKCVSKFGIIEVNAVRGTKVIVATFYNLI
jgi:hypothetical protein